MNKLFRGLLVMGAAAVVTVGSSLVQVKAAPMAPTVITVSYDKQHLSIAKGTNTKIYVAPTTVTTRKVVNKAEGTTKEVTTAKVGAATEYDAEAKTIVELSSLAVTKDNYISIWGNKNTEPVLVKLPAIKTKLKAAVNAADTKITIQDTTDAKNPVAVTDAVQYCTLNGSWQDYTNGTANLDSFAKMGATLRFRLKASVDKALAAANLKTIGTDAEGNAVQAYVADGNFAGNEIKAKVAKTAAGPKATIDYNLRTIKVPVTSEYRFTGFTATALAAYTQPTADKLANGNPAKIATLDVDTLFRNGGEFDLRNQKTDTKPASKITEYHIYPVNTISAVDKTTNKAPTSTATDVSNAVVGTKAVPMVECVKVVINSKTQAATVTLQNNTADKYQIVVIPNSSNPELPAANARVKATLNLTKEGAAKATIVNVAAKSGELVYIRKMGDAKQTTWSSPYILLGHISNTFPAAN